MQLDSIDLRILDELQRDGALDKWHQLIVAAYKKVRCHNTREIRVDPAGYEIDKYF